MEGTIITVVEPSKCQTSIRKIEGENPRDQERQIVQDSWSAYQGNSIKALDVQINPDSRAAFWKRDDFSWKYHYGLLPS